MDDEHEADSFKKPCSGSKRDLLECLRKSDCVQKVHYHLSLFLILGIYTAGGNMRICYVCIDTAYCY